MKTVAPLAEEQIEEIRQLAARVAEGPQLHNSPKLRDFFDYVVDCALRDAPDEATEQQIGINVFHRNPGYSSGDDSIVRSQARLLRGKLAAYFAGEGASEPIIIEIPKGQYLPVFRNVAEEHLAEVAAAEHPALTSPAAFPRPDFGATPAAAYPAAVTEVRSRRSGRWLLAIVACSLLAAGIGYAAGLFRTHPHTPDLDAFWKPFYGTNDSLVIFSNPTFVGDPYSGLRLLSPYDAGNAEALGSTHIDETYTGTGEVAAVHTLSTLFARHEASFTLKPSGLVTWDEARGRSLIFVGAPSQNLALNDLPALMQFHIALTPDHRGYIVNDHPRPGEPVSFDPASPTQETAIVAWLPGFDPRTRIAIFSGLTTVGTAEAVEFFSQPDNVRELMKSVPVRNGLLQPFEAVLRIQVSKGVGMGATLVLVHPR
jgi:hypothetical protein